MSDLAKVSQIINEAINNRVFPGAVLGVIDVDGKQTITPFGHLKYEASSPAVTVETIYDVASVTKSIPTSSIIISLIQDGRISLDEKVIKYLPEINNSYREQILIRHLLTYTAVFDTRGGLSSYAEAGADKILEVVFNSPLLAAPGEKYYYTNVQAGLMGLIAERVYGKPLDEIAKEMFFEPLAMGRTTFRPEFKKNEIAPTEIDERGEIWGQVHDESAWVLSQAGKIAGSAGLFSTAGDLLKFMKIFLADGQLQGHRYFKPEFIEMISTNQIDPSVGFAGLGWEIDWPSFNPYQSGKHFFGKTGFTGCLVLADLDKCISLVLISNRTYPHRPDSPKEMNAVRRAIIPLIFG